jgi:hypothetical protein
MMHMTRRVRSLLLGAALVAGFAVAAPSLYDLSHAAGVYAGSN